MPSAQNLTDGFYNLQNSTNANDIYSFVTATNDLTGQYFMLGVLIVGVIIILAQMLSKGTDAKDALLVTAFIGGFMSMLFLALNLIPLMYAIIIVVACALFITVTAIRSY